MKMRWFTDAAAQSAMERARNFESLNLNALLSPYSHYRAYALVCN